MHIALEVVSLRLQGECCGGVGQSVSLAFRALAKTMVNRQETQIEIQKNEAQEKRSTSLTRVRFPVLLCH